MFPFLELEDNIQGYFQPDFSGYINPRKMIEAQLEIAQNCGCQVIRWSESQNYIIGKYFQNETQIIPTDSLTNSLRDSLTGSVSYLY